MFQILLKPENKTNVYLLFEYKSYLDNLIELVRKFIFTNDFIHLFLFHGNGR
ncbi:hypothetical protein LIX31_11075 [Leptospira kirschneri]|uniref:hypothetical protein n=1 Tax=Leptospira kirschneri TaxID=29507 RepID=UPI0002785F66|nr:hypothetical protein [Leptospira kirschneri]EJO69546.1 hypothetical protein LEP1GSC044_2846 [Leptospira kirschneri serovar Grippotyphosa str. RM52]EMK05671.1 hypothetical protein LEP1GSC176_0004 [Leptospira kirschneri str. MMD1493]EMO82710.1 hypothetical protein LEP1GSC126_2705 [Leptospira kirschneri str. 200801774]WBF93565.1 hypothetical protein LIX31_11075 [Leptospira kirschneri]